MASRLIKSIQILQLALLALAAPLRAQGIMAAASDDGRLYWSASNASGAFSGWTQLNDFGSSYTRGIAIGNFDKDYYPDIISGRNVGNEVTFFRFSGTAGGGFKPAQRIGSFTGTGNYLMDMASGDFNGDDIEDFAANTNSNVVAFWLSDGVGGYTSRTENIEHSYGRGMDAGDFNGDGILDLARARCCDGALSLYLGDGTGRFTFARTIGNTGNDPYGVAAADFDGDGNLDILSNEGGGGDPRFFKGNGDGTFAAWVRPVGGDLNNYSSLDAFDYNGDGRADLVGVNYGGQRAFFMAGMGNGNFGPAVEIIPTGAPGNLLAVAAMPYAHPRAPRAVINPDHVELAAGSAAHFDASGSSAPAGTITSRDWIFGDGLVGTGAVADHTYTVKGRYWVLHRVRSDNGMSGMARALATVSGAPPRAEAGGPYVWGESQSLNGTWTGELDGSATQDDGGDGASYVWNLMPDLTFSEDFSAPLDASKWTSGFANVQDGTLRIGATSGGDWGGAHLASRSNFTRRTGMTFQTRFQSHGGEAVMFGFKNTTTNQSYTQLQYAFYFYHTTLYIYENGSNRGNFRTVPYNTWHDFKIELTQNGADYWYRAGGSETWDRVYQSTFMGAPELKAGITGYYQGYNEFDEIYVGRREVGRRVVTSFGGPAVHPVTLTVTDFLGQSSTDSFTVTTAAGAAPVARTGGPYLFGEGTALNGQWVASLDGSASSDDNGIAAYQWEFGDGGTGAGPRPTHTYAGRGPYAIRLTVTDHSGLSHSDEGVVGFQVANPPVASFTGPDVADESRAHNGVWTVPFDAGASTDDFGVWRYQWAFGNGTSGTGRTAIGSFTAMGAYQPEVTVFDHAGQSHSAVRTLNVVGNALPVARITAPDRIDEDSATNQRWRIAFGSGTSTDDFGIWRHEWTFGDGNTSTLASPTHQYAAPGVYNATLRVFDHAGQAHTDNHSVTVAVNNPPVARFLASPTTAEGRRSIAFDANTSTDDFGISRYDWDFGTLNFPFNGTALDPLAWAAPVQVIQDGRIIVTGTGYWGPRYLHSIPDYQRLSEMTARVRTAPVAGSVHAMFGFKNTAPGTSYEQFVHALYFNNGSLGVYENGASQGSFGSYLANTEYEIRIVTKAAGADYHIRRVGEAEFRLVHSSTARTERFLKPGLTAYSGTWEFDDLAVRVRASDVEASATFEASADPVLTVTDHGGQTHSATQRITIVQGNPPVAALDAPSTFGVGLEVPVSGLPSSDDYGIALYEWDFGDGTPRVTGDRAGHVYAAAGVFTLRLTVTDYAGQATSAAQAINITGTGLVRAVPWRFNGGVEIPHDTWAAKEITLKAVANTARAPLSYTWDFGDGTPAVTGTAATTEAAFRIEARHAYAGTNGTPFIATITIVDADGTRASDTYPVVIKERSLTVETNVAIDEALWYLHKNQTRTLSGTDRMGYWSSYAGMRTNSTASAVQAFEINGHAPQGDPAQDPYVETVRRGLDFIFTLVEYANIGSQTYGNPDANNNGIGITGVENDQPYQMGAVIDAIIASGSPDALTRTGGANVRGRRYRDVVQDMADMYAWGQEDAGWAQGGWRYSWHGGSDNSAAQWAAIGLIPAEKLWGIQVPAFVKEQNRVWTGNSYLNHPTNCGFGYSSAGHSHELTPSGLVQLAFQGSLGSATQWDCAERRMDREWTAFMNENTTYGYYAFTKAMRLAQPVPVINLRETGRDWFDAEPNGLRRTLVTRQRADGSWLSNHPYPSEPLINTAWTTIILTPTLFENPPVAIIHASPNPGAIGQPIRFDGNQSYHLDPFRRVVSHAWDFDAADGIDWAHPDAEGAVANRAFGSLRSYTVSLRVGDDQVPAHYDVTTIRIDITIPPHPPTAVPGGPYVAAVGEQVSLDGSGSFDIDRPQGDSITRYGWEIDFANPRDFDDALGARPTGVRFDAAGTFNVGLRVTDNTALAFPSAGQPDLTHDAFTTVQVQNRCLDNLQARTKETMVALTWTHDGSASYSVLRSTAGPSLGFQEIGRTSSTYSTFVDYNVEINRTYYYRVQSARDCGSYAVTAVPRFRTTNRRPVISSQAVTAGQEGQAYAYDVNAVDPDGSPLAYFLDQAPAGMAINAGNGLMGWTPTFAQVGQHPVAVRVSDGVMSAVQAFILTVAPRANLPPSVTIAGPPSGIAGQVLAFSGIAADPEGDGPIAYAWNFGDGATAAGPGTSHAFGAAGTFLVTLFATDSRGATGQGTHTVVVEEPNRPPVVRAGGPYSIPALDTLTLDGSASSDPDGDALAALWNFGDDSDPVAGTVVRHVYASEGTYQASLELRDGRGGISTATVPVVVTSPNHAPVARLVASGDFSNPGEELRFDATQSTDADGDALVYTWDFGDGSGTGGEIVTHVYAVPGHYAVTLTADDQRGRLATASVQVHVNAPPIFQAQGPLETAEDEVFLLTVGANDADGDALTFSLPQGPSGMTIDPGTGRLFWRPGNESVGDHAVRLRAEDGWGGAGERTFQLRVLNVNDAPVITSTAATAAVELQAYAYGVTATDVDAGDPVTFALSQGPSGMAIDPLSGLVTWLPGHADVGQHPVVILAVDGNGASAEQAFAVTVAEQPWTPEFTSTPPVSAVEDAPFQYQAVARDLNAADVLAFSLVEAPTGMAIGSASGLVTWLPDNGQVGDHAVRIRVTDGSLSAEQAFSLAVSNTNDAPAIVSTAPTVAVVGEAYVYDVVGSDPDVGDVLAYSLVQSSGNAAINASTGHISWTPTEAEVGDQAFLVRVADAAGLGSDQAFTARVQRVPEPPVFTSAALTSGTQGEPYAYQATASDPNGDALDFALVSGPSGMAVTSAGLVSFTPGPAQVGDHAVRLSVTDSRFTVEQAFVLSVANVNDNPIFSSAPPLTGTDGITYQYEAEAIDLDGDALEYSLIQSQPGMAISSTGLLTWPDDDARPSSSDVILQVSDGHGGTATQSWTIEIVPDNVPPVVSIRLSTNPASPGQFVTITVEATDNVGIASRSLRIGGSPVPLSGGQYVYESGTAGDVVLEASATDPNGNTGTTAATLHVSASADRSDPVVTLTFQPAAPQVDQEVIFTLDARDNQGIDPERIWLLVDGVYVPVSADGTAHWRASRRGEFRALATAYDLAGNMGQSAATLTVSIPGADAVPPDAQLDEPAAAVVFVPTPIMGTASDENFAYYTLSQRSEHESEFHEYSRSAIPVVNGALGQIDPSLLENGRHHFRLTVYDKFGNSRESEIAVEIDGGMKLGVFTLSFRDMRFALPGLDIEITRAYDSRVKSKQDFGIGWSLGVKQNARVEEDRVPGRGWKTHCRRSLFGSCIEWDLEPSLDHEVTVQLAGAPKQKFGIKVVTDYADPSGLAQGHLEFTPMPGTYSSLRALDNVQFDLLMGDELMDLDFEAIDPNLYELTLSDGTRYVIDQETAGVTRMTDPNGNAVSVGHDGIVHSNGTGVVFTRDAADRITAISDGTGRVLRYGYDGHGNLQTFTDANGNVTRFKYGPNHHITDVIDPRGVRAMRTEYDEYGRVIRRIGPDGDTARMDSDPEGRRETVEDFKGNRTFLTYDGRGNILTRTDGRGRTWAYAYDSRDNVLSETDPEGNVSRSTFDAKDNPLTSVDPLGNTTRREFDAAGRLLAVTDPLGRTLRYEYDSRGNPIREIGPDGAVRRTREFDSRGNILVETDAAGAAYASAYDAAGRRIRSTDPLERATLFSYDGRGNLVSQTDPSGGVVRHGYDLNDNRIFTVDEDGDTSRTEYNSLNLAVRTVDRRGHATVHSYDVFGLKIRTLLPDGNELLFGYDENANPSSEIDQDGNQIRKVFDPENRLISVAYPDGASVTNEFDDAGRKTATVDENGVRTTYVHDAAGRNILVRNALGQETWYEYDAAGRKTAWTDALGRRTETRYDDLDRESRIIYPGGSFRSTAYDAVGRKVSETDPEGRTMAYAYNPVGDLVSVTDPAGGVTRYAYDNRGNRLAQTDANGHATAMEYDAESRLVSKTYPDGSRERYGYDASGNRIFLVKGNGDSTAFEFDAMDRETARQYPDGHRVVTVYTALGQPGTVTDHRGATSYQYDARKRQTRVTHPDGSFIASVYDRHGNRTRQITPYGTTHYDYDGANRLHSVIDPNHGIATYIYDAVGNLATVVHANGAMASYAYDSLNRLTALVNSAPGGAVTSSFAYTLNHAGLRTKVREADGSEIAYSYDNLNRLVGETRTGSHPYDYRYTYDAVGNRLTAIKDGSTTSYAYDEADRLLTETASTGTIDYRYDAAGRLVRKAAGASITTYAWVDGDRLETVAGPGGAIGYQYDAGGFRVMESTAASTRKYLVDAQLPYGQVVAESDGGSGAPTLYTYGLERINRIVGGDAQVYLYDGQGSVRQLSDMAGAITDEYLFSAFGEVLSSTGSTDNRFLYRGEQLDPNIGFYYLRARWMDPSSGRFISSDAFQGDPQAPVSLHRYLYANQSPLAYADPSGNFSMCEMGVAMAISAIIEVSIGLFQGETSLAQIGENLAIGAITGALGMGVAKLAIRLFKAGRAAYLTARLAKHIDEAFALIGTSGAPIAGFERLSLQMVLKTRAGEFFISSGSAGGSVTGALKHLVGELAAAGGNAATTKMAEAMMIRELEAAVTQASLEGITYGSKMLVRTASGTWELIFEAPGVSGPLAKLFHALPLF